MIDQAERLRELEVENESLKATIDTLYRVEKENEVLRELMNNAQSILKDKNRSFLAIHTELYIATVKLQVLEESE